MRRVRAFVFLSFLLSFFGFDALSPLCTQPRTGGEMQAEVSRDVGQENKTKEENVFEDIRSDGIE